MKKFREFKLFPTSVVQVSFEDEFSDADLSDMMSDVDELIESGFYAKPPIPTFQTQQILFDDNAPLIWQKLKKSFVSACKIYLQEVNDFCPRQQSVRFTSCAAWAFRQDVDSIDNNPWHNHNPSFLSGVFYLKCDDASLGTEFMDPRTAPADGMRNQATPANEYSWSIFPGWLPHKSCLSLDNPIRYVVAANMYADIKYTSNQSYIET